MRFIWPPLLRTFVGTPRRLRSWPIAAIGAMRRPTVSSRSFQAGLLPNSSDAEWPRASGLCSGVRTPRSGLGVFFGCLLRGVIAVPLDAAGSSEFAEQRRERCFAEVDRGRSRPVGFNGVRCSATLFSELNAQLPAKPMFAVSDAVNGQTPFQIIFTSGTTAEPKGVVLTHRNVLASLQPIEDEIAKYLKYERWVHPLRFLHSVPLSHVFGQFMGLWTPPLLAAEVHFGEQLEPSRMTELIRREHISVLVAVPRVLHLLRTHLLARYDSLVAGPGSGKGSPVWKRWWCFRQVHRALGWKFWAVISGGATLPPIWKISGAGLGLH